MTTMTQAETAEALKSSKSTIRRYKYVVDEEDEETKKKMEKFALNYKG